MNIFESLENLNVSEECFDEILNMVEELLSEDTGNWEPAKYKNKWSVYDKTSCVYYPTKGGRKGAEKRCKELNTKYPEKPRIDLSYENLQVSKEYINSIMGIVEEILSEKVTVERARKAAEKSIPARQKECEKHSIMAIYDPDFPANYDSKATERASARLRGAEKMAELPKGDNRDYAKLRKAARKARLDRKDEVIDATEYSSGHNPEIPRLEGRYEKADLFATDSNGRLENKK